MSEPRNWRICKPRTMRIGMTLGHENVTDGKCSECHVNPDLYEAADACRYDAETCACGITWRHGDNGPTTPVAMKQTAAADR